MKTSHNGFLVEKSLIPYGRRIQVQNVYKQYDTIGTLRIRTIAQDAMRAIRNTASVKNSTDPSARYVLNDISFNLAEGKSLGFVGHNGSGKTTLLRLLAGVSLPTKGGCGWWARLRRCWRWARAFTKN